MKKPDKVLMRLIIILLFFSCGNLYQTQKVKADECRSEEVISTATETDADQKGDDINVDNIAPDSEETDIYVDNIGQGSVDNDINVDDIDPDHKDSDINHEKSDEINNKETVSDNREIKKDHESTDIDIKKQNDKDSRVIPESLEGEPVVTAMAIDIPALPADTVYNGIDYSKVYNYSFYIEHNPDVMNAFQGDPELTLKHFVEYGMKERRIASDTFDVNSYSYSYKDLRTAFNNYAPGYYLHYIKYGQREGRQTVGETELQGEVTLMNGQDYSDVFDYSYYIDKYPDIKNYVSTKLAPDSAALDHFIRYGMKEQRQGNENFDVHSYSNAYQDLRLAFGEDAPKYYMHYIKYGKREGRQTTGVSDLRNPVYKLGGKDYSRVYDYDYYINSYADIKKYVSPKLAPDAAALDHFVRYGMREQRQASENFNVNSYFRSYQDLRRAFRKDYPKYYEHYIKYGYKEKRKTTGETKVQNPVTEYGGTEFGAVYDYDYYINKYKDIKKAFGDDDIGTLYHFVRWGMNEGRAAKASYNQREYDRLKKEAKYIIADEQAAQYKYSLDRLLKNAMLPIGQTMYIWGGGWNEEDTGAGVEAVSIGVSPRWKEFADKQSGDYDYNETRYQIHDGLDCTGYIGWMVYNTFNDASGGEGYVSEEPEEIFLSKGWGSIVDTNAPKPGDICSTDTHVWMSLGCCPDGSILIAHASPPGCYICGTLLPDGSRSQAVVLAESIMSSNYPEWYRKYPDCSRNYSYITDASVFRWNSDTLADPNNIRNMSAYEVVEYLFR